MGASAVIGPIFAGFIIDANIGGLGWRPMFLINITIGLVGLIAAIKLLPHDRPNPHVRLDIIGSVLLGATMLGLIFGLIQGSTAGWTTFPIVSILAGVIMFIAFAFRQRYASNPLIQPSILANKGFTSGLLLGLAYFAAVNGLAYVISLFFQMVLHLTPAEAAFGLSPMAIGIIGASLVCGPLVDTLGRKLVIIGLVITLVGAIGLWATVLVNSTAVSAWLTAPAILIFGIGMGACFSSIYDVALGDIKSDETGSASGSLSAVQQLASAIGSAVVTTIYFNLQGKNGSANAMTFSILVVVATIVVCLGLVWLMPRTAPVNQ